VCRLPTTATGATGPNVSSANALGGSYVSRTLPGDLTIALEVGPTEEEYGTRVSGGPIVAFSDALCVYDKDVADRLARLTRLRRDMCFDRLRQIGKRHNRIHWAGVDRRAGHAEEFGACLALGETVPPK
jgi:hypothetical protein